MAKTLESIKEQIRKAEEKKQGLLKRMKEAEAAETAAQNVVFAKIGRLIAANPDYLTMPGRVELRDLLPGLAAAEAGEQERATPEDAL